MNESTALGWPLSMGCSRATAPVRPAVVEISAVTLRDLSRCHCHTARSHAERERDTARRETKQARDADPGPARSVRRPRARVGLPAGPRGDRCRNRRSRRPSCSTCRRSHPSRRRRSRTSSPTSTSPESTRRCRRTGDVADRTAGPCRPAGGVPLQRRLDRGERRRGGRVRSACRCTTSSPPSTRCGGQTSPRRPAHADEHRGTAGWRSRSKWQ